MYGVLDFCRKQTQRSFTAPSGPGYLLLLRVLMHSLKALLSSIEECSQFLQGIRESNCKFF